MQGKYGKISEKFVREVRDGGNAKNFNTGDTEEHRVGLLLPGLAVHHAFDPISQVQDVEINQQPDSYPA
jgi:hypothetical protein